MRPHPRRGQVGGERVPDGDLSSTSNPTGWCSLEGRLQTAPWTDAFGLPSEPWVFVIDAAGNVTAKFETILAADEMGAAIDRIAPTADMATAALVTVTFQTQVDHPIAIRPADAG